MKSSDKFFVNLRKLCESMAQNLDAAWFPFGGPRWVMGFLKVSALMEHSEEHTVSVKACLIEHLEPPSLCIIIHQPQSSGMPFCT